MDSTDTAISARLRWTEGFTVKDCSWLPVPVQPRFAVAALLAKLSLNVAVVETSVSLLVVFRLARNDRYQHWTLSSPYGSIPPRCVRAKTISP